MKWTGNHKINTKENVQKTYKVNGVPSLQTQRYSLQLYMRFSLSKSMALKSIRCPMMELNSGILAVMVGTLSFLLNERGRSASETRNHRGVEVCDEVVIIGIKVVLVTCQEGVHRS